MTTHTRTGRTVGRWFFHDHIVIGTHAQINNIAANHRSKGGFVEITSADSLPDGRCRVALRLHEHRPARSTIRVTSVGDHTRTRVRPTHQRTRVAVIVTAITGVIAGFLAAAAYLLGQLVEFITAHAGPILGVLALALIGAGLSIRQSGRRHCPGC